MDTKRIGVAHEDMWPVGLHEHPNAMGLSRQARLPSSLSSHFLEEWPPPELSGCLNGKFVEAATGLELIG